MEFGDNVVDGGGRGRERGEPRVKASDERVDARGAPLWKRIYTGPGGKNGTGEFVVTDRASGGYAVYMDTQNWGDGSTGGNFAIMHLEGDA